MTNAYEVTTLYSDLMTPYERVIRKRRDAAKFQYINAVYEAIKSQAGLDTAWGHEAMRNARGAFSFPHETKVKAYVIRAERVTV